MAACTIFPHHVSDSCGLSDSQVLNVGINLLVTYLHLPDDGQYLHRLDVGDRHRLILQRLDGEILDLDLGSGTVFPHGKDDAARSGSLGDEVAGIGNQCALAVLLKLHFIEAHAIGKCHATQ